MSQFKVNRDVRGHIPQHRFYQKSVSLKFNEHTNADSYVQIINHLRNNAREFFGEAAETITYERRQVFYTP